MNFDASGFVFKAPDVLSRARRVLIKPCAGSPKAYPETTSPALLGTVIQGIRQVSDADIVLLEGTPAGSPIYPIFQSLGYDFPRVLTIDVRDTIAVEVENPLTKPLAISTFWIPNVILSCDYLISIAPLRVISGRGYFSIMNLLTLLPANKYDGEAPGWRALYNLGIDRVLADLYFTLPFDLGIIEGRQLFTGGEGGKGDKVEPYGKIFVGEPHEVDQEATQALGLRAEYLELIKAAKIELGTEA
ncbi:MAG: DUF362 domain-containing protein [Chloroflexota bacterium]